MAKTVGGSFLFLLVATLFVYLFFFPPFLPSHELRLSIKHKYTYRVHLWWCQKYLHRQRRAAILEVAVEVDSWCRLSFSLDPTSVASDSRALPYWPTSKAFDISVTGPRRILMVFHNSKNPNKICISLIHRREKCPIKKCESLHVKTLAFHFCFEVVMRPATNVQHEIDAHFDSAETLTLHPYFAFDRLHPFVQHVLNAR